MASELGLNPKKAKRAGLLHDIGKVPDDEPELPHAILGMKLCEKYKEKPDICNAVGAHHDEVEMQTLLAPIVQVCDAISGARPGARREIVEAYIKRLNDLEQLALSYPGVVKTYAIQAGRELRVIVGADKIDDKDTENLSAEIAKKIQDEMTYPGQVKITVIRETRAVATLSKNIININKRPACVSRPFYICRYRFPRSSYKVCNRTFPFSKRVSFPLSGSSTKILFPSLSYTETPIRL